MGKNSNWVVGEPFSDVSLFQILPFLQKQSDLESNIVRPAADDKGLS